MLRLICSPFHLGRPGAGMASGPRRFLDAGARALLEELGQHADERWVSMPDRPPALDHEIGNAFAVQAALAEVVADVVADGDVPVVLGGNCSSILGVIGGRKAETGLVFLDAHADANTPETTTSGFLDGMPVAVATGRCWQPLAQHIPGFTALPDASVLLVGQRSVDAAEQQLLDASAIGVVDADQLQRQPDRLSGALDHLARQVPSTHIHVDLDVIDSSDGLANEYWAEEPGPPLQQLVAAIEQVSQHLPVNGVSLTSYNPEVDTDGRALDAGMRILRALVGAAS